MSLTSNSINSTMENVRPTKKNEEAISPIIGVILIVTITVILAVVVATVFGTTAPACCPDQCNQCQQPVQYVTKNITIVRIEEGQQFFVNRPNYIYSSEPFTYQLPCPCGRDRWEFVKNHVCQTVQITYKQYYDNKGCEVREITDIRSPCDNCCTPVQGCGCGK